VRSLDESEADSVQGPLLGKGGAPALNSRFVSRSGFQLAKADPIVTATNTTKEIEVSSVPDADAGPVQEAATPENQGAATQELVAKLHEWKVHLIAPKHTTSMILISFIFRCRQHNHSLTSCIGHASETLSSPRRWLSLRTAGVRSRSCLIGEIRLWITRSLAICRSMAMKLL
jgi:hypothetical protein